MALGLNLNGGGDAGEIIPYVKYDSRAGRISRSDRKQQPDGSYANDIVDITATFRAVMDLENIEVGYLMFAAGAAPQTMLVPLGSPMPIKPSGDWKQGLRIMLKLHSSCGGDIREMSSNAASFLRGFDELHTAYEAAKATNPGKLPVVALASAQPVTTGQGAKKSTNYMPVFSIVGWAPRPTDLVHVAKTTHQTELPPAVQYTSSPPSTGSTPVAPPVKATPVPANNLVAADDDFG